MPTPNQPVVARDRAHLKELVMDAMAMHGDAVDLNHIDVSGVTDMHGLFKGTKFVGDVSKWNTSGVEDMSHLFEDCSFNGDISQWNTGRVKTMRDMFDSSAFNGDISKWDVSKVETMAWMFHKSVFNDDLSNWNVSSVTSFTSMFKYSPFRGNLSKWSFHADMDFAGMLTPETLHKMKEPMLYHWATILEKNGAHPLLDANPKWHAHFEQVMPVLNALGISRHECARQLQARWLLGPNQAQDILPLPELEH